MSDRSQERSGPARTETRAPYIIFAVAVLLLAAVLALALGGDSGGSSPAVTPAPTVTPTPAPAAIAAPTASPDPAAAVTPTVTPAPTAAPTAAPSPSAAPTAAPTVTPTAAPAAVASQAPCPFVDLKVGDVVRFGSYEQDNDVNNGAEPIEWQVVELDAGRALLLSRYVLDKAQYHNTGRTAPTWATCDLRVWLNDAFYNGAFSADDRSWILLSDLSNEDNPNYLTRGGDDTQDRVFLLSIQDTWRVLSSDVAIGKPTAYAEARGVVVASNGNSWYWLRSPGLDTKNTAVVYSGGAIGTDGMHVTNEIGGLRPAIWVVTG